MQGKDLSRNWSKYREIGGADKELQEFVGFRSVASVRTSGVSQGGRAQELSIIDNVFSVSVRTAR